jgi:uncharacterized membrane protein
MGQVFQLLNRLPLGAKRILFVLPFLIYIGLVGSHVTKLYRAYDLGGDLAAYDNAIYHATKGEGFRSTVGASVLKYWTTVTTSDPPYPEIPAADNIFGIHFIPTLWVTNVLPSLVFKSTLTTLWMQTVFVALTGFLIAYYSILLGLVPVAALVLASSFLLHPATLGAVINDFHPILMATPFLVGLLIASHSRRWGWFWLCAILACGVQENAPISVAALALVLLVERRWKLALGLVAFAAAYFVCVTQYAIPSYNPGGVMPYGGVYGSPLGGSMGEIVKTGLLNPGLLLQTLFTTEHSRWFYLLLAPTLFLVLASPAHFIAGVAGLAPNLLSNNKAMKIMWGQYNALALPLFYTGAAASLVWILRKIPSVRRVFVLGVILLGVAAVSTRWSYRKNTFNHSSARVIFFSWLRPFAKTPRTESYDKVAALVGPHASLSAPEALLTHLHRRDVAYIYPVSFWTVEYAILDKNSGYLNEEQRKRFDSELQTRGYSIVYEDEWLRVWHNSRYSAEG